MIQSFAATECAICGARHGFPHGRVGDQDRPTCPDCYERSKRDGGTGGFDGLTCLHLCAMEIENGVFTGPSASWADRALLKRLRERFDAGFYRARCGCATCAAVRLGEFAPVAYGAIEARHAAEREYRRARDAHDGDVILSSEDFTPSQVMGLPDDVLVDVGGQILDRKDAADAMVMRNREITRRPPMKAGDLSAQAMPRFPGAWRCLAANQVVNPPYAYGPVDQREREVRDDLSRAYWRDVRSMPPDPHANDPAMRDPEWYRSAKLRDLLRRRALIAEFPGVHPGGYYDGVYWVDEFGECYDLSEVQLD